MKRITVLLFAHTSDRLGANVELELNDDATPRSVIAELARRDERLANLQSACRVAVNNEFCDYDHPLAHLDEVAIIPPVSGG